MKTKTFSLVLFLLYFIYLLFLSNFNSNYRKSDQTVAHFLNSDSFLPKKSSHALAEIYSTCELLWSKNANEKLINSSIARNHHAIPALKTDISNCSSYFDYREEFYIPDPITKDEENFPIAFSLLVYHNFDQIEQLFMSIYRRQNFYCFHVDASSHSAFKRKVTSLHHWITSLDYII